MSKKNFKGGLDSLLQPSVPVSEPKTETPPQKKGRPKTVTKEITKSSQDGTKEGETRATFIVKEELLEKLKAVAYWERVMLKDILNTILQEYIDKYKVKPRPEGIRLREQEANQRLIKDSNKRAKLPKY